LFVTENPQTFDNIELLEIEIANAGSKAFAYTKRNRYIKSSDYSKIESRLSDFIGTLEANEMNKARNFMEGNDTGDTSAVVSFLSRVKNVIPTNYKNTKLIGYRELNKSDKLYEVDFVVISADNVMRMLKAVLMKNKNGMKFHSITI